jgi:hypothetical protein
MIKKSVCSNNQNLIPVASVTLARLPLELLITKNIGGVRISFFFYGRTDGHENGGLKLNQLFLSLQTKNDNADYSKKQFQIKVNVLF